MEDACLAVREQEFGSICWTSLCRIVADLHGLENERIEPHFSTMLPLAVCVCVESAGSHRVTILCVRVRS